MSEFTIQGHTYKTARLDAMSQWAVARRLAPVVAKTLTPDLIKRGVALMPKFAAMQGNKDTNAMEDPAFGEFLELIASLANPFMEAMAEMPDEHSEFVINTCLRATHRQQGPGWAPVKSGSAPIQFADIDMVVMLQIVVRVVLFNLAGFSFASLLELAPATQQK